MIKKPKPWFRLAALGAATLLVVIDQWIKGVMPRDASGTLIPFVAGLRYTENTGISFSLFGESAAVMAVISVFTGLVILAGIVLLLAGRLPGGMLPGIAMILAGGAGNLIDRALQGYVVDYIELLFMQFAIFNFADILITCGVAWLAGWMLFSGRRAVKEP